MSTCDGLSVGFHGLTALPGVCVGAGTESQGSGSRQRELRVPENPPFLLETCKRMATCRVTPPENFIFQFIFGREGVRLSVIHGDTPNSLAVLPPRILWLRKP